MSRVFLADEVALNRQVVIKVLPPDMAAGVNKERFERETQLAASLQHPLIVPILTAGSAAATGEGSDLLYYVMPFIAGQSLRERIDRNGALPVNEAVRMLRDVADALARAHEANVVHRDIKPDNVMLSGKHAMVTDFGIAKAVSAAQDASQAGLTQFGMALGTPMYMAPEQAAGDPNADHRADLYALGVVAYEVLTGRLPFEAKSPQALLAAHVSETPAPITQHDPSLPAPLAETVMKCLEKQPGDRFQTAADLFAALDAHAGSSSGLTPATSAINLEAFVRTSHPAKVGAVFVVGGAAIVGVVYLLMIQLGLPDWTLVATSVLTLAAVMAGVAASAGGARFSWPRMRNGLVAGYGMLAIAVATYTGMRVLGIGPVGTLVASGLMEEQDRLILARFDNLTSDSTLGETVTELLRIDLAQSPTVTLLELPQITAVLQRMERDPTTPLTFELATEVATREGAKAVLGGEIRALGSDFVVSARLVAASTGETLAAGRETASGAALIEAVDRLSASLRERIGESLRSIRADAPLDQVTTRSTEALRWYAQADRANNLSDWARAIPLLEQAIAADSMFAMAHRKLAIVLSNQDQEPERARAAFTRAYELRDRLTERERYLAEAAYFSYVNGDRDASNTAYTTLLERYPTDRIALNNLAVNYLAAGRDAEAEGLYRRSIALGGAPAVTYTSAVATQYGLGMADTAAATLARFEGAYPEHPALPTIHASFASAQFDHAEAERRLQAARNGPGGHPIVTILTGFALANVALTRGQTTRARQLVLEAQAAQERMGLGFVQPPREVFEAMIDASYDLYFRGEPQRAVATLDRVRREVDFDSLTWPQRGNLQFATVYARAGRTDTARELIRRYESDNDIATDEDRTSELWGAYGSLALAEKRFDDAIRDFTAAGGRMQGCPLCFMPELGEAQLLAGMPDSAIATYDEYLTTPVLTRSQTDSFYLWGVLVRLGEAYESVRQRDAAVEAYSRFVDLWASADEELEPIVEDVRGRISRLVAETTQ